MCWVGIEVRCAGAARQSSWDTRGAQPGRCGAHGSALRCEAAWQSAVQRSAAYCNSTRTAQRTTAHPSRAQLPSGGTLACQQGGGEIKAGRPPRLDRRHSARRLARVLARRRRGAAGVAGRAQHVGGIIHYHQHPQRLDLGGGRPRRLGHSSLCCVVREMRRQRGAGLKQGQGARGAEAGLQLCSRAGAGEALLVAGGRGGWAGRPPAEPSTQCRPLGKTSLPMESASSRAGRVGRRCGDAGSLTRAGSAHYTLRFRSRGAGHSACN